MTLQTITPIYFPKAYAFGTVPFPNILLDAATDRWGFVFQVPVGDTGKIMTEIGVRVSTVTATASLDCRIETVDPATGYPTGTLYGGSAPATNAGPFSSNTFYVFTFTTGATVTAGNWVAVVIQFTSTAGSLYMSMFYPSIESAFPYIVSNQTGSYAKQSTNTAVGHIRYSDGAYAKVPVIPYSTCAASASFASPAERGNVWIPRFKCRVAGVFGNFRFTGDAAVKLYEGVTSPVEKATTTTIGTNMIGNIGYARLCGGFYFTAPYVVTPGAKYFVCLSPSGAGGVYTWETDVYVAGALDHLELGQDYYHGSRSGGAVTETLTKRAFIGLIVDQLDDGAGGSGVSGVSRGRLINSGGF